MHDPLTVLVSGMPWPFTVRPSLENLADPDLRHLIAVALLELGLAALLLTIAVVVRRGKIVPVLLALPLFFMQGPSLSLLLVEATPTSFRPSPTGFSTASIAAGRAIFAKNCVACHGEAGDGVGGKGAVADLRLPHIWGHPIGDLFWFVSHGIEGPEGTREMPAFEQILSEGERWSAIDYVRALNAGAVARGLDGWPQRVQAPSISLSCASLAARAMFDLRGNVVRVILGALPGALAGVPPVSGIKMVTVWLPGPETEAAAVPGVDCVARGGADEAAAYAILAGSPDGHLVAARFLIDPDGVLRSVWRKDDGDNWADPERLLEEVRTICTEPLTIEPGDEYAHHH